MSTSTEAAALSAWGGGVDHALHQLEAKNEDLIARTMAWSAINSGSFELAGLARMRAVLAEALAALPGAVEEVALAPTERVRPNGDVAHIEHGASLRVRVRPEAPIQVALTGHYDTVFPAAHPFQTPKRDTQMLHGPGCADMKGGIAIMLAALEAFEALPGDKRVGYEVLLSPDEEIGSIASAPLLKTLGERAHFGMTYEPATADGGLVDARKGSGNYSLVLRGRAAHVGRAFAEGRNAVLAAAEAALALNQLNGQRNGVTFNVGAIEGGSAVNVVPDNAVLRFNARAPDADLALWADQQIKMIALKANEREGLSAALYGGMTRPPKPLTTAQSAMIGWVKKSGAALGLDLKFAPSGGVCEGNNLAAAGCPNIDTLGPCGGALHSDQEFALVSSFAERAKLSLLLLAGVNSGAFDVADLRA